jgi:predicted RNase H-like nuclease (RuvC/YqgF family)
MRLINTNRIYYDNDFEKWYFEDDEDFENAQVVDDNYVKENQELKQQLAEKGKEVNKLKDNLKDLKEEISECYVDGQDYIELREQKDKEIVKLKEQLAEKDKEIEDLKGYLQLETAFTPIRGDGKTFTKFNVIQDFKKQIRHQVCEEIRAFFDVNPNTVEWDYLNEILNEIEQGEQR